MAPVAVSASMGAMNTVLSKLFGLLTEEYRIPKTTKREVERLIDELSTMQGALQKLSDTEDRDSSVKRWASQVREMTYDLEDIIDLFLHSTRESLSLGNKLRQKMKRPPFEKAMQELRARVREASDRMLRYGLHTIDAATPSWRAGVSVDPSLPLHHAAVSSNDNLVGIDARGGKLIEMLAADDHKGLKVVAIVGMGGSGKTTLAINVYERLQGKFECRAFVSASRNPDIMVILRHILHQVGAEEESVIGSTGSAEELVRRLREFLYRKRFLIVTDDIWSTSEWRIIKTALPENNSGSRILVTTRIHSVAHSCCYPDKGNIFPMQLLTYTESKTLFFRRLFGSEESCPPNLVEVLYEIMKKCGGLPLAINSMAGLLARTSLRPDCWGEIRHYVNSPLFRDAGTEVMGAINLSYIDLPSHLKTCLLYLSMFPEDHVIDRKQLVRRWIAEGFITEELGQSSVEVGEKYFNELLNRSLIQLVRIQYDNRVDACQVHDIILDFIVSKAAEENFVITYGSNNGHITGLQYMIRRLSLDYRNQCDTFKPLQTNTSHVRSLAIIGPNGKMPDLANFGALRVLDLESYRESESHFMKGLRRLHLLKYLKLQTTSVVELPKEIGEIQYLQTLDLSGAPGIKLPKTIVQLQHLKYLLVSNVKLPDGFGRMTSLEELSCIKIDSTDALKELENLFRLKVIGLKVYVGPLVSSHHKLSIPNLRSLYIESADGCSLDFLLDFWSSPCYELQEFQMKSSYFLPMVPKWVSSLDNLSLLCINIEVVGEEVLQALGDLRGLISLELMLMKSEASGQGLIIRSNGFKRLKIFEFTCWNSWTKLIFEQGAMKDLEKLLVVFSAKAEHVADVFHIGLEHLSSLKHLVAKINCRDATAKDVHVAEDAITNLIRSHPNQPRIELQRHDGQHIIEDEWDISVHDEEDNDQDEVSNNVEREIVVEEEYSAN